MRRRSGERLRGEGEQPTEDSRKIVEFWLPTKLSGRWQKKDAEVWGRCLPQAVAGIFFFARRTLCFLCFLSLFFHLLFLICSPPSTCPTGKRRRHLHTRNSVKLTKHIMKKMIFFLVFHQ
ncbi:hypothetical protein ACP275_07G089100 [Erythranthe tilingii]